MLIKAVHSMINPTIEQKKKKKSAQCRSCKSWAEFQFGKMESWIWINHRKKTYEPSPTAVFSSVWLSARVTCSSWAVPSTYIAKSMVTCFSCLSVTTLSFFIQENNTSGKYPGLPACYIII